VVRFNYLNKLRLVTRAHQISDAGFEWKYPDPQKKEDDVPGRLVTVWSAPNYAYRSANAAAVMKLRFSGKDEFDLIIFHPAEQRIVPTEIVKVPAYFQ
jgi:hypothetical protein